MLKCKTLLIRWGLRLTNVKEKYGRWKIISTFKRGNHVVAECICDCGTQKIVRFSSITGGDSTSCGCYAKECASKRFSTKGGISKHPLYHRWQGMNRRCYNNKRKDFKYYGGRGISVCDEWIESNPEGFNNFLKDMEATFITNLELDREDNDGCYCKDNCRWVDRTTQVINRRYKEGSIFTPRELEYQGEVLHLKATADKFGLSRNMLSDRLLSGMSLEDAINKDKRPKRYKFEIKGNTYNLNDIFKVPPNVYAATKRLGLSPQDLVLYLFKDFDVRGFYQQDREWHTYVGEVMEDLPLRRWNVNKSFIDNIEVDNGCLSTLIDKGVNIID